MFKRKPVLQIKLGPIEILDLGYLVCLVHLLARSDFSQIKEYNARYVNLESFHKDMQILISS